MSTLTEAPPGPTRPPRSRRPLAIAGAVVVAIVLVVVLTRGGGTDKSKLSATKSPSTIAQAAANADASASGGPGNGSAVAGGGTAGSNPAKAGPSGLGGTPNMPVDVTVSNTKGLRDGDTVHIHLVAKKGSSIFGFEAFLCNGGTQYNLDPDIRPSLRGNCVTKPLSPVSQDYVAVRGASPYASVDGDFKVGMGSDSYTTSFGKPAHVVCGHDNPCALVLKLQYPEHFGFYPIPVTFL